MNVERTIEFILKTQAKTDGRLNGITTFARQGIRMLAKTQTTVSQLAEAQKRTESSIAALSKEVKELAKSQRETERTLRAFIRAQHNGLNGR